MNVYLKIKIMSLAAEAQIIRQQTKRFRGDDPRHTGLYRHRLDAVRPEARSAQLAYGFLRGRTYAQLENWCHEGPDWKRIEQLILKYGQDDSRVLAQQFAAWKDAAAEHLKTQTKPVFTPRPKVPYVPKTAA
jgi:hypothetical protein